MIKESETFPKAIRMKLASMNDLVRMAFFSAARNNGLNFLYFGDKEKKSWYLGFLTGVAGYYDLRGIPMFFYVELKALPDNTNFIKYQAKEKEKWDFVEATTESTLWIYLPVIQMAETPMFF
ncbi:MAG: hypothetical protein EAX90_09255 [Candidatus Heimdallarchaeota archaeon]|nr:hypothetical protein [Candidatus Heimdallarchaeota archaeon]